MSIRARTLACVMVFIFCLPSFFSPLAVGTPFWKTSSISGDPLFFIRNNKWQWPTASLLLVPRSMPALQSATGEVHYEPGADFIWKPGSRLLKLPPGSRVPFKTREEIYSKSDSPDPFLKARGHSGKKLLFAEGHFFHDLQVVATYQAQERWTGFVPQNGHDRLPKTMEKLKRGEPISLVILGDSISAGANASGVIGAKPYLPPYPDLVAQGMKHMGASNVTLTNLSVGGMRSEWGTTKLSEVAAAAPDILIVAFGMNDANRLSNGVTVSPTQYADHIRTIIEQTRDAQPGCEFILIAGMMGNPEWAVLQQDRFHEFRNELKKREAPGVAVADVTSLWKDLLKRKSFYDLTGNGLNHPNDFGHQAYADVVLELMGN